MSGRIGWKLMLLSVVAGSALVGTAVFALTTSVFTDSQGAYHGCVSAKNGALRVINPSESCKQGETAITWNQTGPQGDIGPQGIAGPAGPALSSLNALNGIACSVGGQPGTVALSFATGNVATVTCVVSGSGSGGGIENFCSTWNADHPSDITHASYTCNESQDVVSIQSCFTGWTDTNGLVDDGCEEPVVP